MNSVLENVNNMISQDKETLSVLPKNNKKNTIEYLATIEEMSNKYKRIKKRAISEIDSRYNNILRTDIKQEVKELKDKIDSYQDLILLDDNINSYEKMELDEISYNLNNFYKNDLNLINEHILKCIQIFKKCGIELTAKDFKYNQYTYKYMVTFFEEINNDLINSEKIRIVFEEVYWKCSNILKYINLNIQYLYYKNLKEIDKYFKNEKNKMLEKYKSKSSNEILHNYMMLKEEYFTKYNSDEYVLLNKFTTGGMDINRFTDSEIKSEYSKIVKLDIDKMNQQELDMLNDNIYKLSNTLYEYKKYLKYINIIDNMKKRNAEASKTEYNVAKDLKQISQEEAKLMKINTKIDKANNGRKGLINKQNKIVQLVEKSDTILNKLQELYDKLEESILNTQIKKMFSENATIYELLYFASYRYSYFSECIKNEENEENQENIAQLKEFLSNPQFNVLIKNIRINDDKKIDQMIKDGYYLFNIEIQEENLKPENLDGLIEIVDKIVLYNNIKKSEITVPDIKFMCELKRIKQS